MPEPLLQFTGKSIYCAQADVHIDPWMPVERAIITHAHSDHARWGSRHYLAHTHSETVLRMRLGHDINLQTTGYGQVFTVNGVKFSLHPAGHILGSAQVRVEYQGEVWVASGDYKLENDGFSAPFEVVKCHTFITESTFGLPVYKWQPQSEVFAQINEWRDRNREQGKASVLTGYALGKMQRIVRGVVRPGETVFAHGAVYWLNERLRNAGYDLPALTLVTKETDRKLLAGSLVLAPPSVDSSPWIRKFTPYELGYCSGWMAVRGAKNRRALDRGFVLSDHADWPGLNEAVKATQAQKVYVTHGFTSVFARWLNENGIEAGEVETMYGHEEEAEPSEIGTEENNSANSKEGDPA